MGYNTDFSGELQFKNELTASQIAWLEQFMSADCREHPEWENPDNINYIELEITEDYTGLRWTGTEKTYNMCEAVNLITREMRKKWPDFELTGEMEAQGEDMDDTWKLVMDNGVAIEKKVKKMVAGDEVCCPHCNKTFKLPEDGE